MKHTYKIHPRNEDGTPNFDKTITPTTEVENIYESEEAAKIALLEGLRLGNLNGDYKDYPIQEYDEQGEPVEAVDEADREAAAADARTLVQTNQEVTIAFNAMIAARQLYAFAFNELDRTMATLTRVGTEDRQAHPLATEVLVQAATRSGGKSFKADELFARLGENIFPWMNHVIRKNVVADENDKRTADAETDRARRAVRLPVGVKLDPEHDGLIDRDRPLVLIGYGPAVRFLLDAVVNNVLSTRDAEHPDKLFTVIRFDAGKEKRDNQDFLLRLPRQTWTNCARSKDKLGEFVAHHVAPQMNKLPDLLVVDDLASTFTLGAIASPYNQDGGGYAPFRLAEAQKRLSAWYKHVGMGLVAGVMTSGEQPIDCGSKDLEQLRTHCDVRPVTVVRQADDLPAGLVRIVVGKNAWRTDVDAKLLEPAAKEIVKP